MCGIYYCITCMCKSHLHLVSFPFVSALYYALILNVKDTSKVKNICVNNAVESLQIA